MEKNIIIFFLISQLVRQCSNSHAKLKMKSTPKSLSNPSYSNVIVQFSEPL